MDHHHHMEPADPVTETHDHEHMDHNHDNMNHDHSMMGPMQHMMSVSKSSIASANT